MIIDTDTHDLVFEVDGGLDPYARLVPKEWMQKSVPQTVKEDGSTEYIWKEEFYDLLTDEQMEEFHKFPTFEFFHFGIRC